MTPMMCARLLRSKEELRSGWFYRKSEQILRQFSTFTGDHLVGHCGMAG